MSESQSLGNFLSNVNADLKVVVDNIKWMTPEREDIHEWVSKAWKELQPQFEIAHLQITRIDPKSFRTVGLSGSQLELKIAEYRWRGSLFHSEFDRQKASKKTSHHLRTLVRRLSSAADNVLDTLASVLPPVQPIKEFKDTLACVMHP